MLDTASVSPLETHLGYWLRFVSNQVSHAFRMRLQEQDTTVAEWVVLRDLYDREATAPSEVAERLGMTRGAITKLVDRLLAKDLLTRSATTLDRRYQALALTPKGRALVPALSAEADANDADFFGHLDPAARTVIESVLKDIVRRHGLRAVPVD
ncbi:MarR family transcriptional regulator [Aquabacter sp. CN5-332]|uniref:MarR family winged helix-turn-helix transcriptional regulator n=1 Tax=Aquabacter sp. CN5-332 TaxID=3156608 RepID=UPI0032B619E8